MKKVLSLVLALVLVLGMIPTFAAGETGAELLFEHEFIYGDNGDLMVDKVLTREELAVLFAQLNGVEVEAAAFVKPANYTDADLLTWSAPYVSYAQEMGWMIGDPEGTFRPQDPAKGKELLAALMNALDYEYTWETVVSDAAALELTVSTEEAILRGAAFETMWYAVSEIKINGTEMTIGEKTGKIEPTAPVVTDLEVASVTATNLKTMVIEFNKAVDEATVTSTTVKVMDDTTNVVDSRLLSENGMTLTVVYNTGDVDQSTELDVTIDGVKSLDGTEEIEDYEMTTVVTDVEIPTILGVSAQNAKQLIVYFSEPLNTEAYSSVAYQVINDFKIDDVAVIAKVTPNHTENSAMFELSTILEPDTYEVKVTNMVDFAGYKALTGTFTVTVVEDTTAPVITGAVVKNLDEIEVTFDEALSVVGNFYVDGVSATPSLVANSNGLKYSLALGESLDLGAVVQVKVEYQNQKDIVGNKVSTKTAFLFSVADDTTLPEVDLEVKTGNKLVFTFSKTMMTSVGTLTIYDEDEDVVVELDTTDGTWSVNNTVFTVLGATALLNDVDVDDYTIEIEDMKDATVRTNLLPDTTIAFKALDTRKPAITASYFVKNGTKTGVDLGTDDTITFYFSEKMDADTLNNLSNYNLAGPNVVGLGLLSSLADVEVKSVASDLKSVTITLPDARDLVAPTAGYDLATDANDSLWGSYFTVYALKDEAGNMINTSKVVRLTSDAMGVVASGVNAPTATATDKVVLNFDNKMLSVDPSFIAIEKWNATDMEYQAFAVPTMVTLNAAGTKATFTLNKALATTTGGYRVATNILAATKNIYGDTLNAAATWSLADQISPEFDSVVKTASNKFVVNFTEEINESAGLIYDLKITDLTETVASEKVLIPVTDFTIDASSGALEVTILKEVANHKFSIELVNGRYIDDNFNNTAVEFEAENVQTDTTSSSVDATFTVTP